ncbi:MAG: hypothetical protein ACRDRV_12215 [Pseudonocardiaceae bacterium]
MRPLALVGAATASTLLTLAGCAKPWDGTRLDEWAWYACQDFNIQVGKVGGAQLAHQLQPTQRRDFVLGLSEAEYADNPEIQDAVQVMATAVNGTQQDWQLSMNTFAQHCRDGGVDAV